MAFEEEPHVQSSEQESPIADAPEIEQSEHVPADVSVQAKPDIEAVPHELSSLQDPPSKIRVGGVELTADSTLKQLRDGCTFLSIGKTGSKAKCWQRLSAGRDC